MKPDPIVEEAREAGEALFREAGCDWHRFCENLRAAQRECANRMSDLKPLSFPAEKKPRRVKRKPRVPA